MSLKSILKRILALFVPPDDTPDPGPVEIFETAIREARQRFLELRATASPLYQSRDALTEQEEARARDIAEAAAKASSLAAGGRQKEALEAASRHGKLEAELERVRHELADLARPIAQVEERLRRIEGEVRELERERDRSAALLKSADARLAVDRILAAQAAPASAGPVAQARDQVDARLAHARAVEQVTAGGTEAGLTSIENALEEDRARKQLEAITNRPELPPGQEDKGL